jgi:hypothetical protein
MANAQVLDWLYENELRAYPLVDRINRESVGYTLTDGLILDAQFVFDTEQVVPTEVTSIRADELEATVVVNGTIEFSIDKLGEFPQYIRLNTNHLLVVGEAAKDIPTGEFPFSDVTFEPSVVFELADAWKGVESITFGESDPLLGIISLFEGYQFRIDFNQGTSNILFGAHNLYGEPIGCEHFGMLNNDCNSIVSYINGVTPDGNNELKIVAGTGTNVWDDPDNHRIYIGFSFTSIDDICKPIPGKPLT